MKKVLSFILVAVICFAMFFMSGCRVNGNTVNIGYFNNITHPQALYMKSQEMLEKEFGEEIKVKWNAFNAGPAEVTALFSGNIDIGYMGPGPAVNANVKTIGDVKILTSATKGGAVMITRKDLGINTVSDLAGKRVAIPQLGNTQHLSLLALLEENGLKATSEGGNVTVCAVSNSDVANTMDRGDIDAALVPEPWGATLINNETHLLLDYKEIYMNGKYDVAVVVVRTDFYEKHPDIVEKFLMQHNLATDLIKKNKEESLNIINKEIEKSTGKLLSNDILTQAFTRIEVSTQLNKESILGFAQISENQDMIEKVPNEKDLFIGE